jgi:peptidylprolyl isomerase
MAEAKSGDTVRVSYTGKLDDGTVFDSSQDKEPLEFTIGKNRLIQGFETGVIGMTQGQSKTIRIQSDQAYGPYRTEALIRLHRSQFPDDIEPQVGQRLNATCADGYTMTVTVAEVTDSTVTLDSNHLLAGENLTFDVELIKIL